MNINEFSPIDQLHFKKAQIERKLRKAIKLGKRWEVEYLVYESLRIEAKIEKFDIENTGPRYPKVVSAYHVFKQKRNCVLIIKDGDPLPNLPYATSSEFYKAKNIDLSKVMTKNSMAIVRNWPSAKLFTIINSEVLIPESHKDAFTVAREKHYRELDLQLSQMA